MSDFPASIPASSSRRLSAFFINFVLIAMLGCLLRMAGVDRTGQLFPALTALLILVFCAIPESPGKRLLKLRILDLRQRPIGIRIRIVRALPPLIMFGAGPVGYLVNTRFANLLVGVILTLSLFFILANAVAVKFSPDDQSFLDLKLGTRVMAPRISPAPVSPDFPGHHPG